MRLRAHRPGLALTVVVVLLMAACADSGGDPEGEPSGTSPPASQTATPSATTSTSPTATGPTSASPTGPTGPTGAQPSEAPEDLPVPSAGGDKGRSVTVSGTVEAGVEGNCVLLGQYLLLGGPREILRPGRTVTVTGRLDPDARTTCQQGTPLQVERAVPTK
jgi:hypothetical protein